VPAVASPTTNVRGDAPVAEIVGLRDDLHGIRKGESRARLYDEMLHSMTRSPTKRRRS
jgi:hypothetical protein